MACQWSYLRVPELGNFVVIWNNSTGSSESSVSAASVSSSTSSTSLSLSSSSTFSDNKTQETHKRQNMYQKSTPKHPYSRFYNTYTSFSYSSSLSSPITDYHTKVNDNNSKRNIKIKNGIKSFYMIVRQVDDIILRREISSIIVDNKPQTDLGWRTHVRSTIDKQGWSSRLATRSEVRLLRRLNILQPRAPSALLISLQCALKLIAMYQSVKIVNIMVKAADKFESKAHTFLRNYNNGEEKAIHQIDAFKNENNNNTNKSENTKTEVKTSFDEVYLNKSKIEPGAAVFNYEALFEFSQWTTHHDLYKTPENFPVLF